MLLPDAAAAAWCNHFTEEEDNSLGRSPCLALAGGAGGRHQQREGMGMFPANFLELSTALMHIAPTIDLAAGNNRTLYPYIIALPVGFAAKNLFVLT